MHVESEISRGKGSLWNTRRIAEISNKAAVFEDLGRIVFTLCSDYRCGLQQNFRGVVETTLK